MKTTDYHQFEKRVRAEGYRIGHSTRHHVILNPDGDEIIGFAVNHSAGSKRFVLDIYVKKVMKAIAEDQERRKNNE